MIIQTKSDILPSEITAQQVFAQRRHFIQQASVGLIAASAAILSQPLHAALANTTKAETNRIGTTSKSGSFGPRQKIANVTKTSYGAGEKLTPYDDITSYNNYYEFGTDKGEPAVNSKLFKPHPWTVSIEGEVKKK